MADMDDYEIDLDGKPYLPVGVENVKNDDLKSVKQVIVELFTMKQCGASATKDAPKEVCVQAEYSSGEIIVNAFGFSTDIDVVTISNVLSKIAAVKKVAVNFEIVSFAKNRGALRVFLQTSQAVRDSVFTQGILNRTLSRKKRRFNEDDGEREVVALAGATDDSDFQDAVTEHSAEKGAPERTAVLPVTGRNEKSSMWARFTSFAVGSSTNYDSD